MTKLRLCGAFLLAAPCAFALNPALDVSQYAHTAWRNRDGFARGEIQDLVQTSDGYLWLGTKSGLLRFDGVRAVPWQPPSDQHLPSSNTRHLLAARDGTLWIGTLNGLVSWKTAGSLSMSSWLDLPSWGFWKIVQARYGSRPIIPRENSAKFRKAAWRAIRRLAVRIKACTPCMRTARALCGFGSSVGVCRMACQAMRFPVSLRIGKAISG